MFQGYQILCGVEGIAPRDLFYYFFPCISNKETFLHVRNHPRKFLHRDSDCQHINRNTGAGRRVKHTEHRFWVLSLLLEPWVQDDRASPG